MKQTPKKPHEWTNEEREALDEMYDSHHLPMISEEELRLMEEEENHKRRRRTPHELWN